LRARKSKHLFITSAVSYRYMGHKIDAEWLHPLPDKLEAIMSAPILTNFFEVNGLVDIRIMYKVQ